MTVVPELAEAEAIATTTRVTASRIGVIAENHSADEDGSDLPPEVLTAFENVDLIVHLGHMGVKEILGRGVLGRLEKLAPVLAVRDYSTNNQGQPYITPAQDDVVNGLTRVIDAGGVRIGLVHNLSRPPGPEIMVPPAGLPKFDGRRPMADVLAQKFGDPVDVVAFASSHRACTSMCDGVFFVNPGSPTYPKGPGRNPGDGTLGTVGILHVINGRDVTFETIELSKLTQHDDAADG